MTYTDATTDDVTTTATWASSDEAVATVTSDGSVTAVGAGTVTITATHSGLSDTCTVTVPEPV